jgi:indolepyruvate ferredoxin oxidoreductase, beta subunit
MARQDDCKDRFYCKGFAVNPQASLVLQATLPERTIPLTILVAALGGEGGGVLMNWIVGCALKAGLPVQSTSVPGVAQRTGSTSYYIEIGTKGTAPVFALVPMPGRVDIVVASELAEAGRLLERGFVNPRCTTLITSTSRVLTTAEKLEMGDGRFPSGKILDAAEALSKRLIAFDLERIAREAGTIVSAPMFGALAGSGVLPWLAETSEAALAGGRGAAATLAGFRVAFALAAGTAVEPVSPVLDAVDVVALGKARCLDYMDQDYAGLYAARFGELARCALFRDALRGHALEESARRLALWMTYEDVPRVADLKRRPERLERIRQEAEMTPDQVLQVTDLLKPGIDEIAAMLPVSLAGRLLAYHRRGGQLPFVGKGIHLKTTSFFGGLVLTALSAMGRLRRQSLRYRDEQQAIETWLAALKVALANAPAFAGALAELPRLRKGYGETQARGLANYNAIFDHIVTPALARGLLDSDSGDLRKAIAAALADPESKILSGLLAQGKATA